MHARLAILTFASLVVVVNGGCTDAAKVTRIDTPIKNAPSTPPPNTATAVYQLVGYPLVRYSFYGVGSGNFELRYGSWPGYYGPFTRSDSAITFAFWSTKPEWCTQQWCEKAEALADVHGDTLFVKYDSGSAWLLCTDMMDFDACSNRPSTYVRSQ